MKISALFLSAALVCVPFTVVNAQNSEKSFTLSDDHANGSVTEAASLISGSKPVRVTYFVGSNKEPNEETIDNYGGGRLGSPGNPVPTAEVPNYYIFDFAKPIDFGKLAIDWEGNTRPANYYIHVSNDKKTWEQVANYATTDKSEEWDNWVSTDMHNPVSGQYLKITIVASTNKDYTTRLDHFYVEEPRIPSSIKIFSDINGFNDPWVFGSIMTLGESATITSTLYDQNGKAYTNIVPTISSTATENEWNNSVYTPAALGNATFTATYGDLSASTVFTTSDLSRFITAEKFKEFSSSATDNPDFSKIVVGPELTTKVGEITLAAKDGLTENYIEARLERVYKLEGSAIYWDCAPVKVRVYASLDGEEWKEIASEDYARLTNNKTHIWSRFVFPENTFAKYIKVETEGIQTNWGVKIGALKLYGEGEESIPTSIAIKSSNGTALCSGESTTFTPILYDQFGAPMDDVTFTWSHTAIPENWNEETCTYTASDRVAGGEGVTFTATYTKGDGNTISGDIVLKGFNLEHYLFDSSLHEYYKNTNIDLRAQAAAAVTISTSLENNNENPIGLFDGGKDLNNDGAFYQLMPINTNKDEISEIIVKLYDPVTIEAIVLNWDAAVPKEYKVELSNHGVNWAEVAHYTDIESTKDGVIFDHRLGVRYNMPITMIKITTFGNASGWGLQLRDFKAYGLYADVAPHEMTLSPYVNVTYTKTVGEEEKSIVNDHPNTVAFLTPGSGDQFGQETVYLKPMYKTENGANFHLKTNDTVEYTVTRADGSEISSSEYDIDSNDHKIVFHEFGEYVVNATSTKNGATVSATTRLKSVRHNAMVIAGLEELPELSVKLFEAGTENETHSEKERAAETLMSGRTDYDGGVTGSINLSQNDNVYDVVIDFGKVIDIPAIEVLWEGACPQKYSISYGREADFSDAKTVDHFDPMRRAVVDRPRFDRFAVETPNGYVAPSTNPEPAAAPRRAEAADPMDGSKEAIRYIKLHNITLDPWMGGVWGAKLAEITPYFDPITTPDLPTGIEDVTVDNNADAPVEYYTLQGVRISEPVAGMIVIRRQGNEVSKILVK